MDTAALSPGFFTSFAWNTFTQFRDVGIGLVVVLTLLALIVELVSVHKGGGMETSAVLVRAATAIFLLGCFQSIVEGAKDFVWSMEKMISAKGSIETTLANMKELAESSPFWSGSMGRIKLMFAGWGMTLASYFSDFIFWLYGVLWLCVTVSAPILIPTVVMEATQKVFRIFLFFMLGLLFARIPWAMVSAVIAQLVEFLSIHGKDEELRAFFLFWIALFITALTPLVSTLAFLKADGVVRGFVDAAKLGGKAAGHAVNGGLVAAGQGAWAAQRVAQANWGKGFMSPEAESAFSARFGPSARPPGSTVAANGNGFEKRAEARLAAKPT